METITKKRIGAYLIDLAVATAATAGVEYFLRKRVKSETVNSVILPTVIMGSLEFLQLKSNGQTVGYRMTGLQLKSRECVNLTSGQILKRAVYREILGTCKYFSNPKNFEKNNGAVLPQDVVAGTIVREV